MENRQQRVIAAFEKVLGYLVIRPVTPEPPLLTGLKKSLRTSIDRIEAFRSIQHSTMMLEGGRVAQRRTRLRRAHLIPLVRTVKPHLTFAPGAERVLKVPHARADALTVAQSALAIAAFLKGHRKLLAAAGYSSTYLSELQHEARGLALAAKQTAAALEKRAKATRDMALEIQKGMNTVMSIEGMVLRQIGRDKNAVAFWKERRKVGARVGRPPRRRNGRTRLADSTATDGLPPMNALLPTDEAPPPLTA